MKKLEYTCMNDYMFKEIFKNQNILCGYLNKYCNLNIKPEDILYGPIEIKDGLRIKGSRFDIRVNTDRLLIDIEAQRREIRGKNSEGKSVSSKEYQTNRKIHYASQLYASAYKEGQDYVEGPRVIVLWFLEYEIEGNYIQHTRYVNKETNEEYKNIEIIEISLKNASLDDRIELEPLKVLIADEVSKYLESKDEIVKEVAKMIYKLNDDELAKAEAKLKEDNQRDLNAYIRMHRQEGYDEGLEKGAINKNIENAKRFKELGVDIEIIMNATGLSKEEIDML